MSLFQNYKYVMANMKKKTWANVIFNNYMFQCDVCSLNMV